MSIRKRNEFLDGDDSEEELENGYNSEDEAGRGAIAGNSNKRRKVESESEASFDALDDEEEVSKAVGKVQDDRFNFDNITGDDFEDDVDVEERERDIERSDHDRIKPNKSSKSKAEKELEVAEKAVRKSGVVYISRVPPFMKPQTLKHFLEPHARKGLGRIFLTPEDHAAHAKRVKSGGNKKKSFTDGWVEFKSKNEAKIAAETLNGNIIGGKKGNFYRDDLWNMKYLKGFKWNHLTEQIANENAERAARTQQEIRKTRKENKAFVEDIERAKMLEGMESKKKAKMERGGAADAGNVEQQKRDFKQRKPRADESKGSAKKPVAEQKVMKMIL
ncbi:hypothetical protein M409DRAFT_24768 [Zasmidium cellare ATCC 36951]|uniref:18S rRNA factor 2 n=1 Tax=Zasmidium cellare ATCC 36951 TaxID=1080233 RepID=A0A6A6CDR6_ZASCE|nr:uncharacterized protein M409DRAFT_24768 [Zasmidium cellare ATCC 36951]KAF2164863.1 hypothetical protein M409DRAFT_24768 [Zasmidium cellare ATCC 36951]